MNNKTSAREQFQKLAASTDEFTKGKFAIKTDAQYETFLRHVKAHKYLANQNLPFEISDREAFQSWYENVYTPLATAIDDFRFEKVFPDSPLADLYLKTSDHRYFLELEKGHSVNPDEALISYGAHFAPSSFTRFLYKLGLSA